MQKTYVTCFNSCCETCPLSSGLIGTALIFLVPALEVILCTLLDFCAVPGTVSSVVAVGGLFDRSRGSVGVEYSWPDMFALFCGGEPRKNATCCASAYRLVPRGVHHQGVASDFPIFVYLKPLISSSRVVLAALANASVRSVLVTVPGQDHICHHIVGGACLQLLIYGIGRVCCRICWRSSIIVRLEGGLQAFRCFCKQVITNTTRLTRRHGWHQLANQSLWCCRSVDVLIMVARLPRQRDSQSAATDVFRPRLALASSLPRVPLSCRLASASSCRFCLFACIAGWWRWWLWCGCGGGGRGVGGCG